MKPVPVRRCSSVQLSRLLLLLLCVLTAVPGLAAGPGAFVVTDSTTDLDDKNPGDGICADINNVCSLRAAITEGNALAGATAASPHTITFSVPTGVVNVINGSLPTLAAPFIITGPIAINGSGNGSPHGCISMSDAGTPALGYVDGATGSTVTLLSIGNCSGPGISANGHGYHFVGNFIGVDPTGLIATPNSGDGISLSASHVYNNVDTSSLDALFTAFPQLPVQQSDISTFANNLATTLVSLNPNFITNNVISANTGNGIALFSENLAATFVSGNMIGTDITGNVAMPNGAAGIYLTGSTFGNLLGPGNTISGNTAEGIRVDSGTVYLPNYIMGNRIGIATTKAANHIGNGTSGVTAATSPDGSLTNKNPSGMSLLIGPGNFISDNQGAPSSTDPELLPTAGAGVVIGGTSNGVTVAGNTIGMAEIPAGTPQQTNTYGNAGDGVFVTTTGNTVGGSNGNVIAGNKRHGIVVSTSLDTSTHILGNTIGLYPAFAGDLTLGNGFDGVHIDSASSTYVGGPNATDFNTIGGNGRNGVKILNGGAANGWSNLVQRNVIYGNARGNPNAQPVALPPGVGVGIDLDHVANASDGPHPEFPTTYANLDQAPPVICTGAGGEPAQCAGFTAPASANGSTTLDWTIATHGPASFRLEFFQINSADDNTATSMTFLGELPAATDATGFPTGAGCTNGRCTASLAVSTAGSHVLMTVTDVTPLTDQPGKTGDWKNDLTCFIGDLGIILSACYVNDTSEFSNVVNVPLSANADLSNLTISAGTLVPSFASATLIYTDAVGNGITSVKVTPTTADASATVTVNGTPVTSGMASGSIPLAVGPNPISVVVTAQDGTTQQTYTVTVNRAGLLSNNANLSNLVMSAGSLVPAFASATLSYTDAVNNGTASIKVTPTTADVNATVTVNGTLVPSGTQSGAIALAVGANPISVVVTAQDGTTQQTYTVTVNRAGVLSNNANLSNLLMSAGSLVPAFAPATLSYTDAVSNATSSIQVTPTTADVNATVTVNGTLVPSGTMSGAIALVVGANPISVVVTAQDGTTQQTYTVTVNRAGVLSNNANLSNLTISTGSLVPAFAPATLTYTDAVSNATSSVKVTPTTADVNATVTVNGTLVPSGTMSGSIALVVGANPIAVVVTAQDGTTTQSYTITVNRAGVLSNNANLSNLTVSAGSLVPAFAPATLSYTDAVSNATTSITLTPTTADVNATVKVNGTAVTSGMASGLIALNVGSNPINVVVTAQDGTTTQSYTVTVNRAGVLSNNANLSNLTVSAGSLVPGFAPATLSYTDAVSNATASITVTPTTADASATVKVNGTAVTSGTASSAIALATGVNNVQVVVTAQDGTTMQTYTIAVNRAGVLSNNASLSNLTVSAGSLVPAFASATLSYTDAVSNATASIMVTPTTADANATVKVNGTAVLSGSASGAIALAIGVNNVQVVVTAQDGTTTQTYTIGVNRAGVLSNNASLSGLTASAGSLVPAFAAVTLSYTDAVSNAIASISVTPTTADANATVTVNGTPVGSGKASGAIALSVGANPITIVVTAQDGTTTQTYTVTVNRAGGVVTTFSGTTATNSGIATATLSGGGPSCGFSSAAFVGAPAAPPAGVNFPDGLFQFTATGCTGTINVQVVFPTAYAASAKYWKYGPTPGSPVAHWYTLGVANNISLAGHTATFTITDGAIGDDDITVNGSITDAGGPAVGAPLSGGIAPTPSLTTWGLLLLSSLLLLLGAASARNRVRVRG
jgi:hypothetical protein